MTIFDIFKRLPNGKPIWIESVEGLEIAKAQVARLAATAPGEYFIYSEQSAGVVERVGTPQKKHRAA